jgi:hypothetical protein
MQAGGAFGAMWEEAAVVAVLMLILYAGHKGWWYWSPGVRALTAELARDRDDWRTLAVTLLRKEGIELPDGYEKSIRLSLPGDEDKK